MMPGSREQCIGSHDQLQFRVWAKHTYQSLRLGLDGLNTRDLRRKEGEISWYGRRR
jgi:hypothetical protein